MFKYLNQDLKKSIKEVYTGNLLDHTEIARFKLC
jgi:hypothetical protein